MKSKYELGQGIIIGLIYGVGAFVMAWFKDSKLFLLGIPLFLIAYLYHRRCLKDNTK